MTIKTKSFMWRYGLGLASFCLTLAVALVLIHFSIKIDMSLVIVGSLIVASWYGGRGPGFMVAGLIIAASIILNRNPITPAKLAFFLVNETAVLGILVMLVATRRTVETRLKEQTEWLRITLSSIGDAVVATDLKGVVTFLNPAAEALIGWGKADAAGRKLSEVFRLARLDIEGSPDVFDPVAFEDIEAGQLAQADLLRRDGGDLPIEFNTSPIKDHLGRHNGAVLVFRDVTERRAANDRINKLNEDLERRVIERTAELNAANQQLESFSYSVSHDLRAPLRALDGFSRILLDDYAANVAEEPRRFLQIIRDNAIHMGRLIDDLLDFARISRKPVQKRPMLLSEVVRRALDQLAPEQEGRRIDWRIGELPACQGDPALLAQVFINLLSNALKYTCKREEALIEVGCQNVDDQPGGVVFYVKDNGVGFDMKYSNKLFEVFQRLHRQEDYDGTGVGLAIVQRIIQRHGGHIWAEAEPGKGATFFFTLGEDSAGIPVTAAHGVLA